MAHTFTWSGHHGNLPQRIGDAITNCKSYILCTSTIQEGDIAFFNYYAPFGLIIKNPEVLLSSPEDAHSLVNFGGQEIFYDEDIPNAFLHPEIKHIRMAIDLREPKKYNEFRVTNYKPVGIFLSRDNIAPQQNLQTANAGFTAFYNNTRIHQLPYFFLTSGRLESVRYDAQLGTFIPIKQIDLWKLNTWITCFLPKSH